MRGPLNVKLILFFFLKTSNKIDETCLKRNLDITERPLYRKNLAAARTWSSEVSNFKYLC